MNRGSRGAAQTVSADNNVSLLGSLNPLAFEAGKAATKALVEDLYKGAKGAVQKHLDIWKVESALSSIYEKLLHIRKVKTIWQLDREVDLSEFYYPLTIVPRFSQEYSAGRSCTPHPIGSITEFPLEGNLLIEGIVGQGKSLLMRYLCSQDVIQGKRLPLFLELRRLSRGISLIEALCRESEIYGLSLGEETLTYLANSGKLRLYLDGFDEVPAGLRRRLLIELEQFAAKHPQTQIVASSRPGAGLTYSSKFRLYSLSPISEEEIPHVMARLGADTQTVTKLRQALADRPSVRQLLSSPLLITLLLLRYRAIKRIPQSIADFYDELFDVLLFRHDDSKPAMPERRRKSKLPDDDMRTVFDAVSYICRRDEFDEYTSRQIVGHTRQASKVLGIRFEPKAFLDDMVNITCLLLREGNRYRFVHKSVAEFHAASFVRDFPESQAAKFYESVLSFKWPQWEQELLFLGRIDSYRYQKYWRVPILEKLMIALCGDVPEHWRPISREAVSRVLSMYFVERVGMKNEPGEVGVVTVNCDNRMGAALLYFRPAVVAALQVWDERGTVPWQFGRERGHYAYASDFCEHEPVLAMLAKHFENVFKDYWHTKRWLSDREFRSEILEF